MADSMMGGAEIYFPLSEETSKIIAGNSLLIFSPLCSWGLNLYIRLNIYDTCYDAHLRFLRQVKPCLYRWTILLYILAGQARQAQVRPWVCV